MSNKSVLTLIRQLLFALTKTSVFLSKRLSVKLRVFALLFNFFCLRLFKLYVYFVILGPGPCTDLADLQLVIESVWLCTEQIITCNNPTLKYICMQDENQFK